jgi:lipopolysaccharide export system protein LptA
MRPAGRHRLLLLPAVLTCALLGPGPGRAEDAKGKSSTGGLLPGASSKEPVSIDAGKLDYFDRESKLIYSGSVVAKQGESTLRASVLTIFLTKDKKPASEGTPAEPAGPSGSSIRRMEAQGPVTVISKDEVGTGDNGSYDKAENKITLSGNVTLTQATNVIKGDRLVYDMTTGQAQVYSGQTAGRVRSVFTPGSGGAGSAAASKKGRAAESAPSRRPQATGQ